MADLMGVSVKSAELEAYLKGRPKLVRVASERLANRSAELHQAAMIRTRFRGYTGPKNNSSRLQRRTGTLWDAMRAQRSGPAGEVLAVSYVAGPLAYARIQEHGGVVRPKRRRYLTIPTPAVLTSAGVTRQSAKPTEVGGKWYTAGKVPGLKSRETFIRRGRKGNPIIYGTGTDGEPVALWVLKKSVKIPPRLGFFQTWADQAPKRAALVSQAGKEMLDGR